MVQVLLGLPEPPRPADRADALALAICHLSGAGLRAAAARRCRQPAGAGSEARHDRLPAGRRPGPGGPSRARPPRCCSKWAGSATGCWCRPAPSARSAPPGSPAFLHVHTHVREDAIVLYGFPTRDERVCFEALIGAHGVGPAVALALLSVHSPAGAAAGGAGRRRRCPDAGARHRQEDRHPAAHRAQGPARRRPRRRRPPARGRRPARGAARPGATAGSAAAPGPTCAPPCPGSATGPTRSATPCPACPPRAPWRIRSAWPCGAGGAR